jgi:hypothetical protein
MAAGQAAAAGAPAPLDTLRPAAAAALARQQSNTAPLTDDDIAAINILLGREEAPSRPYAYNTGLPVSSNASVPHLLTFGNHTPSSENSSMQSSERLSKMRTLGPLSWLARSFFVTGDTLLKLRITQQLQLILQDAISDSAASAASLPPNQVVTFASSNFTLSLGFTGVDWHDGLPAGRPALTGDAAAAVAALPHKGLTAVQMALRELTGNYDVDYTLVSLEPFPEPRVLAKAAAAGAQPRAGTAAASRGAPGAAGGSSGPVPPAAANLARKLLMQQQGRASSLSTSSSRRLAAAANPSDVTVVYVRLHGMDPMNLTSLFDKLGNCSAQPPTAAAPSAGRMPEMPAGRPLAPWCADTFRTHFQQQGVPVQPGSAFTVAPQEKPQASIGLAVAIGLTREQQVSSGTDAKASAWLNGTAIRDIFGTFNLTVASSDADYVAYVRDKESGRYPALPGLNLSTLLPSLVQTVLEANKSLSQVKQQQQAQGIVSGEATAINKAVLAGIIVAVSASVLALVGVVVLMLRRRLCSDSRRAVQQQHQQDSGAGPGPNRRRKVRSATLCIVVAVSDTLMFTT